MNVYEFILFEFNKSKEDKHWLTSFDGDPVDSAVGLTLGLGDGSDVVGLSVIYSLTYTKSHSSTYPSAYN